MNNPVITIEMETGEIMKLELYPEMAPNTVSNFVSLASSGFYNGLIFHRVIADFMIQGGDPDGSGMGGPGYAIKGEFASNGFAKNTLSHQPGVISMARSQSPDSAGSQFFICVADDKFLDKQYAAFGKCMDEESLNNAIALSKKPADGRDRPREEMRIKTIVADLNGCVIPDTKKL